MNCATRQDFCIHQGDDLRVLVEVLDQGRAPMDIQDVQAIHWWVARNVRSAPVIQKGLTDGNLHLGGPNIFFFDLAPEDTEGLAAGNYYHEAEITTAQGKIYTVMVGTLRIDPQLIKEQE